MMINVENTFLISNPKPHAAFNACDRRRIRENDNVNALLEAEFGPAKTSNLKFENGINLRREHKLNALAIEFRKVLLKIKDAPVGFMQIPLENKRLNSCMKQAALYFYTTEKPHEILRDLTARAVKLTDAINHDLASRILYQHHWWNY